MKTLVEFLINNDIAKQETDRLQLLIDNENKYLDFEGPSEWAGPAESDKARETCIDYIRELYGDITKENVINFIKLVDPMFCKSKCGEKLKTKFQSIDKFNLLKVDGKGKTMANEILKTYVTWQFPYFVKYIYEINA